MLIVTSAAEAAQRRRRIQVNGHEYALSEYAGAAPVRGRYVEGNERNDNGLPQGFLVEQPPGSETPPHFHETNQFQVFVDGSGRMGKRAAAPLTIQYANGHTPYGPIVAGPEGVRYFTLRQLWDPGAKYLPANRERLRKGNQRTRLVGGVPVGSEAERRTRRGCTVEVIIEPEADGLAAFIARAGANCAVELPRAAEAGAGGQYLVVAAGSVRHDGRELDRLSTIFVGADDAQPQLSSGADGLDLLILRFPRLS